MRSQLDALAGRFEVWNRKFHYYAGLVLLLFLWLFAFTGLLLNHHWRFAEFWPSRSVSTFERAVETPAGASDLARARHLMRQLGVTGEIEWTTTPLAPGRLDFRVIRPGHMWDIKADLVKKLAAIEYTRINAWGIVHVLHTFTGVRANSPQMQRDWEATAAWSASMDAVAIGLVFLVFSSLYMWYGLKPKRRLGAIVLALGLATCGFFLFGLQWLTP